MSSCHKARLALLFLLFVLQASCACRRQAEPAAGEINASEPPRYSAVVEQRTEAGGETRLLVMKVARDGDLRREEWSEGGETVALILRPDLNKSFLLNFDRQLYVEIDLEKEAAVAPAKSRQETATKPSDESTPSMAAEITETLLEEAPEEVTTRRLPDERVDGYLCGVWERRSRFPGGRVETLTVYRAAAAGDLAIMTEMETSTPSHRVKSTIRRRDIRLQVSADDFSVPAGFKKVESLARP